MTRHAISRGRRIAALLASLLATVGPASAITRLTIQVDGDMSDWTPVLVDSENVVADAGEFAGDPDNPGADRDLRGFAVTWDDQNLYFWWRRTLSANNTISFFVYIDRDFDGLMSSTDMVARYRFSGAAFQTAELYQYDDGGSPDVITGDGVTMAGGPGAQIAGTLAGAGSLSGIQLEGSLAWASIGVAPGSPLRFHISAGTNNNVEDNMEPMDTLFSEIAFLRDADKSIAPGGDAWIPHSITNNGNGPDAIDILVEATQSWDHALFTDPNGDGDPTDGEMMALDSNGDGDFDDPFDIAPGPAHDSDADGVPDTGSLPPGASRSLVLVVTPSRKAANGDLDEITLWARSVNVPSNQVRNLDSVTAGRIVVHPDRTASGVPGSQVTYAHRACNWSITADLLDLDISSLNGWTAEILSDPDGDGDPSDGQLLTDSNSNSLPDMVLPAGACVPFVVRVTVPAGAAAGEQDTHHLTGTADDQGMSDEVFDVTTAAPGVTIAPDHAEDVAVGGTTFYPHVLINSLPATETFDFQATSTLGSALEIFPDPDGDGIPEGAAAITDTGPVPPGGGAFHFLVRVRVPATATHSQTDQVTVTATARSDPSVFGTATDVSTVRNLLTFSDPLFARPSTTFFGACSNVYAEGSGLARNEDFRFVWNDPDTAGGAERTTGIVEPDADGYVDDVYMLTGADLTGSWEVRLQIRSGSSWNNLPVGGGRNFLVQADGGLIESLEPGKLGYFIQGESVAVNSLLTNPTDVDFTDTLLRYVVFEDADGDTLPTPGERFILGDGTDDFWSAGGFTHRTRPVDVLRGGEFRDFWRVTDVRFPTSGTWRIHASWLMSCGTLIYETSTPISVCASLPSADAGGDRNICRGVPTTIGTPAVAGHSYRWFPDDDLDDPDLAQPEALLQQSRAYTLIVVEDATGCSNGDTADLTLVDPPVPDILPDGPVINVGGTVTLDAGPGAGWLWSTNPPGAPGDGATTRTVDANPSGTTTYMVTVTDANDCTGQAQETVTVNPNPPVPVVTGSADTICLGEEVTLDAGVATAEYLWTTDPSGEPGDGATSRAITVAPSLSATYTVVATDGVGQQGSDSFPVTVLTTTPGSVGNTLRVRRDGLDTVLSWQPVADAWTYDLYRSDSHDYSSPDPLGDSGGSLGFRDAGAVDGTRLHLYQVHGMACFEGPR